LYNIVSRLLTTVGKDLESETNDRLNKVSPEEQKKQSLLRFEVYFKDIDRIINVKSTSSRVRFMLQDLVDLRMSKWKPRRDVAGPKTIDQVGVVRWLSSWERLTLCRESE
jgi:translation initiation factor 4G